jgi:ubiquinone/menaquinone biosynthesis C-methylase UbiE
VSWGAARYDGHADWYDEAFSGHPSIEDTRFVAEWLGPGNGEICLDVACGTGLFAPVIIGLGYRPAGLDVSADQLRLARSRLPSVAQADAKALPVRRHAVRVAVGAYFHTDVEDFAAVVAETACLLAPGGRFVYLGLHPCFIGPFIDRSSENSEPGLVVMPGYGQRGWADRGSGGGAGLWARVGGHHKTLTELLGAFSESGLSVRVVQELWGGGVVVPRNIGVVADKP